MKLTPKISGCRCLGASGLVLHYNVITAFNPEENNYNYCLRAAVQIPGLRMKQNPEP